MKKERLLPTLGQELPASPQHVSYFSIGLTLCVKHWDCVALSTNACLFNDLLPRFSLVGVHQNIWPIWPAHLPELDFGVHMALQSA